MAQPIDPTFYNESQHNPNMPTPSQPHHVRDESVETSAHVVGSDGIPRLKRTACILCRRRKLRCDQLRPKCGTCDRLGHDCKYDEGGRKKSGPKRGYVKALEARLAQVETLLKTQDSSESGAHRGDPYEDVGTLGMDNPLPGPELDQFPENILSRNRPSFSQNQARPNLERTNSNSQGVSPSAQSKSQAHTSNRQDVDAAMDMGSEYSFDMISLGLEEPLPTQEIMNDLNSLFFQKGHQFPPMIHKARFYAALDLAPAVRPPVCLRYAMWALAAGNSEKYEPMAPHFYERSRKYLESDEMKGFGQAILTLSHCQTWILVTIYEFKNMFFPRAWMSTGRAARLAQMLGLHRVDGAGLDVKQTLPAPKDWAEKEERRRTFWMAFWCDRCASIGTGWPMSLEEKDIFTDLPAQEENFQNCKPESTTTLQQALQNGGRDLNSISGATLMATLFGRNLMHLHRQEPGESEDDLNGAFWREHRWIDGTLLSLTLGIPDHLKLPAGISDPNVIFLNMCLHSSTICLHQAAIYKADKYRLPAHIGGESKMRCMAAASEIASIMRAVCGTSNMTYMTMNPFLAFCLYVAARVFVLSLKARPGDQRTLDSLTFILQAMNAMMRRTAIAESFIAQLELDMNVAGVSNPLEAQGQQNRDPTFSTFDMYADDGSKTDIYYNPYDTNIPAVARGPARQGELCYAGGTRSIMGSSPTQDSSSISRLPANRNYWPSSTASSASEQRMTGTPGLGSNARPIATHRTAGDRQQDNQAIEIEASPGGSNNATSETRVRTENSQSQRTAVSATPAASNQSNKSSPAAPRKNTSPYPVMGNQLYNQYQQAQSSQQTSAASLYTTDFAMFGDLTNLPSGMETTGMTPNAEAWNDMMEGMSHQDWADQMTGGMSNTSNR